MRQAKEHACCGGLLSLQHACSIVESTLVPHRITPSHIVHTSELSFDDVPIFDPIRDKRARDDHTEQADEMDLDIDSMMR